MAQSYENYFRDEERRELGKLIVKGFCPECQCEYPTLIHCPSLDDYLCKECGLLIQGSIFVDTSSE